MQSATPCPSPRNPYQSCGATAASSGQTPCHPFYYSSNACTYPPSQPNLQSNPPSNYFGNQPAQLYQPCIGYQQYQQSPHPLVVPSDQNTANLIKGNPAARTTDNCSSQLGEEFILETLENIDIQIAKSDSVKNQSEDFCSLVLTVLMKSLRGILISLKDYYRKSSFQMSQKELSPTSNQELIFFKNTLKDLLILAIRLCLNSSDLKGQLAAVTSELDSQESAAETNHQKDKEIEESKARIHLLQTEIVDLKDTIDHLKGQLKQLANKYKTEMTDLKSNLVRKLKESKSELDESRKLVEDLRKELLAKETSVGHLNQD